MNRIKNIMDQGGFAVGIAIFTGSPTVIEMVGGCGFDFVFIDSEHTPQTTNRELQQCIVAANSVEMGVCIRVKSNDETLIRTAFEYGADAVVVAHCRTADDVRRAVRAARFPPQGARGSATDCRSAAYGAAPDFDFAEYVARSDRECLVVAMAEDPEFFDNIDDILAVDGLGAVQLGPHDLGLCLGIYDTDGNHEIENRYSLLYDKAHNKGIPLMGPVAPLSLEQATRAHENGVRAMTLRTDVANFRVLFASLMNTVYRPLKAAHPA